MRGKLILIEGLDRAGKSSQCVRLAARLKNAEVFRFPDRSTAIGGLINEYLTSSSSASSSQLETMHLLFSANRWELMPRLASLLEAGKTVVLDRYVYSGIAYSYVASRAGAGGNNNGGGRKPLALDWLAAPDVGLLQPDAIVFLKVSESVAQRRGGFGAERYEKLEFQRQVARCFEEILPNDAHVIDADGSEEEVAELIWQAVHEQDVGTELRYYDKIV